MRGALFLLFTALLVASAQNRGCSPWCTDASPSQKGSSDGPFLKVADLWLVYTRPHLLLEGGRVWGPARYLAAVAGMGFEAHPTGSVRLSFAGHTLEFQAGSREAWVDGQPHALEASPVVREGRVMVPLREVARALRLSLNWDGAQRVAFLSGPGLAAELRGANPSARFYLVETHRGMDPAVPEVLSLVPTEFQWHWRRGFYASPQLNAKAVHLTTQSGFRLTWKRTKRLPERTFIVLGLGVDYSPSSLGYFVMGYGQYGFPYINEGLGGRDPNDREYCRGVAVGHTGFAGNLRPVGRSRVVCEVGPVLYSEPDPYPREPRVVISAPRFVFARVYSP